MGNQQSPQSAYHQQKLPLTVKVNEVRCMNELITTFESPLFPEGMLGKRTSTGEVVAVDRVADIDSSMAARLEQISLINGDNVLQYYGIHSSMIFREHYDTTLRDYLSGKELRMDEALNLMYQCASGIKTLRDKDIEHWSMTTDNIGIKGQGIVKIFDYHKSWPRQQTVEALTLRNSVDDKSFLAPELTKLPSADIFSLACVFKRILDRAVVTSKDSSPHVNDRHEETLKNCELDVRELISTIITEKDPASRPDIDDVMRTLANIMSSVFCDPASKSMVHDNIRTFQAFTKNLELLRKFMNIHFNICLIGTNESGMKDFISAMAFRYPERKGKESTPMACETEKMTYLEFPWMPNVKIWTFPVVGCGLSEDDVSSIPWRMFERVIFVGKSTRITDMDVNIVKKLEQSKVKYIYVRTDDIRPKYYTKAKDEIRDQMGQPEYFGSHPPVHFFLINRELGEISDDDRGRLHKYICPELKNAAGFDYAEVRIAFVGAVGVGKSTTINTLRGLKEGDKGATKTARYGSCTHEVTDYQLSENHRIHLYDFPGIGTDFTIEKFKEEIGKFKISCFLLFSKTSQREYDKELVTVLKEMKFNYAFVNSLYDEDVTRAKNKSEEALKEEIFSKLNGELAIPREQVFFIQCNEPDCYEYPKLLRFILSCLSEEEQALFLHNLGLASLPAIDTITNQLMKERWADVVASGLVGWTPNPEINIPVDITILETAYTRYISAFKLDDNSLSELANRFKLKVEDMRKCIKSSPEFSKESLNNLLETQTCKLAESLESGASMLSILVATEALSESSKALSLIGTIVGGALNNTSSFTFTAIILAYLIESLKNDAHEVYQYVKSKTTSSKTK